MGLPRAISGYRVVVTELRGRRRVPGPEVLNLDVPSIGFRCGISYDIREADHTAGDGMVTKIEHGEFGHLNITSTFPLKKKGKKR